MFCMLEVASLKKVSALWACMGAAYMVMEGLWRGGWTHVAMFAVGGVCGVAVGALNQFPRFFNLRIFWQSFLGTVIVLCVEFFSGCILNLWLGLGIWDYSLKPGNIAGQICPAYAGLWLFIMPFAIWFEDWLRWRLWNEDPPYTLKSIYIEFITFK